MRRSGASMPGIVSTAIYIFMPAWEEMFFSYTLGARTVPVGIRRYVQGTAGTQLRYDYMAAASVVITIPIALMFFTLQRHFIRGLTAGAVKQPCHIMPVVPSPSLRPLCRLPQINHQSPPPIAAPLPAFTPVAILIPGILSVMRLKTLAQLWCREMQRKGNDALRIL